MCHHRTYRHSDERDVEPLVTTPAAGPLRIGDAERERTAELLRAHAAAGRLDPDELEERLERAYRARYAADLDDAMAELPPEPRSGARAGHDGPTPLLPVALIALVTAAAISGVWWLLWLILPICFVLGGPRPHHQHERRAGV